MVRIGSKINNTNRANPRKTTTSSNYSLVPEIVVSIDGEDSTVLLLYNVVCYGTSPPTLISFRSPFLLVLVLSRSRQCFGFA